jgi:hypothetical protein
MRRLCSSFAILLATASVLLGVENEYEKKILTQRQEDQVKIRGKGSPLYVIASSPLKEGSTALGSKDGSTIILPNRAPALLGTLERKGNNVTFEPSGSLPVMLDEKPIEALVTLQTGKAPFAGPTLSDGGHSGLISLTMKSLQYAIYARF